MPFSTINNRRLFYRLEGREHKPVLVLSHSIGADHGMWAPQVPDLLSHFRVLRYDICGHGASDAPKGDYSIEDLGREVIGLADALKIYNSPSADFRWGVRSGSGSQFMPLIV